MLVTGNLKPKTIWAVGRIPRRESSRKTINSEGWEPSNWRNREGKLEQRTTPHRGGWALYRSKMHRTRLHREGFTREPNSGDVSSEQIHLWIEKVSVKKESKKLWSSFKSIRKVFKKKPTFLILNRFSWRKTFFKQTTFDFLWQVGKSGYWRRFNR